MRKIVILVVLISGIFSVNAQQWTTLASDPTGDGMFGGPGMLDGTKLEYRYDKTSDSIWFRITVDQFLTASYGLNIILNVDSAGPTSNWGWGTPMNYNRVLVAWITGASGPNTIGMCDAAAFTGQNYTNLGKDNMKLTTDPMQKTYTLGTKRTNIFNSGKLKAEVIANTGAYQVWDDNIPDNNTGMIQASPVSINTEELVQFGIYPNPAREFIRIVYPTDRTPISATIYALNGQPIKTIELARGNYINIAELSKGIYYIMLEGSEYESRHIFHKE